MKENQMFEFNFNSRDEYLQQKKVWFFLYKDQVKKIRAVKSSYKDAQRKLEPVYEAMRQIRQAQDNMEQLLKIRHEARLEAGCQYDAQHA
jgi:hypothetical protein